MGINSYKIKKWYGMLTGKSDLYVNQGMGTKFVPDEIKGYYNDLTEKVLKFPEYIKNHSLPNAKNESGDSIVFATTIFQYGLGCYDLLLKSRDEVIESQFKKCIDWAMLRQEADGGWDISSFNVAGAPYGAMAQGEGASLLIRAYVQYQNPQYLDAAKKAIDLMLSPVDLGGTALYQNGELILLEFADKPCVLNGWIFALFGLYDYSVCTGDETCRTFFHTSLQSLLAHLKDFENGYWSMYDLNGHISSPFYHKLHIAQLTALEMVSDELIIREFRSKFEGYQGRLVNRIRAFIVKACQKLFGKD